MVRKAGNSADLLPLPGLYELARSKSAADVATGYHWRPGGELPSLGRHSLAKHDIYESYIGIYIETLTRSHLVRRLKLTIVDGFCGGGRYRLGAEEIDGSPLRMLRAVERSRIALAEARARGVEVDVDFVFIDENADHLAFLEQLLRQEGHGDRIGRDIQLLHSTFEDAADSVIRRIKAKGRAHRSLFFLDQYGWSAVKLATVRRIMSDLENPEVVLTFMVDALVNLLCEKNSEIRALSALDFTREDVRGLIDMKQRKGWKRIIQNTLYKHIQRVTGATYYSPFFIHPPESHRDYWLVHVSKHHQAREEMTGVFWNANNTMEHFGDAGVRGLGFDPNADVRQGMIDFGFDRDARDLSMSALLEQIPPLLHAKRQGRPVTKRALFDASANETPVVSALIDTQLAKLRDDGEIEIRSKRKGQAPEELGAIVRVRAQSFGWDDEIDFVRAPGLFSIFNLTR